MVKQARHALYLAEDVSPKKDPDVRKMQVRLRVPVPVEAGGFSVVWSRKGVPDVRKMQVRLRVPVLTSEPIYWS